jgi:ABC-type Fe3+/spermidine/putrescine transport system ATPase subunit
MSNVEIRSLCKNFGAVRAIRDVSFSVRSGSMTALLGPSGCGKTTLLSCLAGLERISEGEIEINGVLVSSPSVHVPPERRDVGLIFQSYAVWPHMTVFDNVAYGLRVKRCPDAELRRRVGEMLEMFGLEDLGKRPATNLSGGQQQRVALARSVITAPKVLLLDEPLSNLDAKLRERMRSELRSIQKRLGITAVFVTHDQIEAMAMADEIVVMRGGEIQQVGSPRDIYGDPANLFTADFIGECNMLPGTATAVDGEGALVRLMSGQTLRAPLRGPLAAGDEVTLAVRPVDVSLRAASAAPPAAAENRLDARVVEITFLGDVVKGVVKAGDLDLVTSLPSKGLDLKPGDAVEVSIDAADLKCFRGRMTGDA